MPHTNYSSLSSSYSAIAQRGNARLSRLARATVPSRRLDPQIRLCLLTDLRSAPVFLYYVRLYFPLSHVSEDTCMHRPG